MPDVREFSEWQHNTFNADMCRNDVHDKRNAIAATTSCVTPSGTAWHGKAMFALP